MRRRLLYEIDKQRDAGWRFIEHRVEITAFMVGLQLAARERTDVGVLDRRVILQDAPKTRRDRRARLTAKVRIDGALKQHSVDPDEIFGLRFLETEEESYFYLSAIVARCPCIGAKIRTKPITRKRC